MCVCHLYGMVWPDLSCTRYAMACQFCPPTADPWDSCLGLEKNAVACLVPYFRGLWFVRGTSVCSCDMLSASGSAILCCHAPDASGLQALSPVRSHADRIASRLGFWQIMPNLSQSWSVLSFFSGLDWPFAMMATSGLVFWRSVSALC